MIARTGRGQEAALMLKREAEGLDGSLAGEKERNREALSADPKKRKKSERKTSSGKDIKGF